MITNKKELILAAQKFALETLSETDDHKRGKLRHEAFDKLGVSGKHYEEFRLLSEATRQNLSQSESTQLEPAAAS